MQANLTDDGEVPETGVYHEGDEVAVRAKSRYSRSWHEPKTDDDGNVVFDEDGRPEPACGKECRDDTFWRLAPVDAVAGRDECSNCAEDDDAIAKRNSTGSGNITLARLAQRSDWKGAESLSANDSHIHGD